MPSDRASPARSASSSSEQQQPVDQQPSRTTSSPSSPAPRSGDNKRKRSPSPTPSTSEQPPLLHGQVSPPLPAEHVPPPLPNEELPGDESKQSAAAHSEDGQISEDPPLPDEEPPTDEASAEKTGQEDDGWDPVWEPSCQAFYFYNRFTGITTWENPRVPSDPNAPSSSSAVPPPPGLSSDAYASGRDASSPTPKRVHGGYDPRIHGDYDPNADYALEAKREQEEAERSQQMALIGIPGAALADPAAQYAAKGTFNKFTGRFQPTDINPDNHNDENKSRRQMNAFFDVNAAANSHDGRSLRAERQNKNFTKKEIKAFRDKKKQKKEEKRRAWLRD